MKATIFEMIKAEAMAAEIERDTEMIRRLMSRGMGPIVDQAIIETIILHGVGKVKA